MQIDWLTLVAQVVNFVILLVLLHRFLYRPIMNVMAERERQIADRLDQAESNRDEAERERAELEKDRREISERRDELLDEARREASDERERLLEEAREEIEAKRKRWRRALEREREELAGELERRLTAVVRNAVEGALGSLASTTLEARVHEAFLERLGDLDDERRDRLRDAAGPNGGEAVVRTGFELPDERRGELRDAISGLLDGDAEIRFARSEELIAGIELAVGDHRVAWSLRDYLERLEEAVPERLREDRERHGARGNDNGADDDNGDHEARDDDDPEADASRSGNHE